MNKACLCCLLFFASLFVAAQDIDVLHYRYEIELSDASDAITGKATITVHFLKETAELALDLASLDEEKGMMAFEVIEGSNRLKNYHRNDRLLVTLAQAAKVGDKRVFQVSYMGVPKDGLIISNNKYGDRTFFSDNWPDRAHHWLPCNDVPGDKAPVEFIVTAPARYKIISNGLLVKEEEMTSGRKRTHWKEEQPIPTKVMVIGAARFATARVDSAYALPVTAWVYPQDSAKGVFDYGLADDILRFFEQYIGPYPYKKLANVQSKTIFGGMENASAIFYGENTVTGDRSSEALIAHEIAHQWFGNTATEITFAHLWLSEGFATYLTDVYMESKYGQGTLQDRLHDEREKVLAFAGRSDKPVVDSLSPLMDLLNANSYQKGGWVLHMLRHQVGDTAFRKIIQSYYAQYKWRNAGTRDFEAVAERVSGQELTAFFDQWLYRGGVPRLKIKTGIEKDAVSVDVEQEGALFTFPIELGLVMQDGTMQTHKLDVSARETNIRLPVPGVTRVTIDPQTKLLFSRK